MEHAINRFNHSRANTLRRHRGRRALPSLEELEQRLLLSAYSLGAVTTELAMQGLAISPQGEVDSFSFNLPSEGQAGNFARINFTHGQGDLDMKLYDSRGFLLESSLGIGNSEEISLSGRGAGDYRLDVYGYASATNAYSLTIKGPQTSGGDWAEPNDSRASANNLGAVEEQSRWEQLSIHAANNEDWFRFETTARGGADNYVRIDFAHSLGDVDMRLYDSAGNQTGSSTGTGNSEQISLSGCAAGTYFVKVYGYAGQTNPSYSLTVNGPSSAVAPDWAEPNDSRSTAYSLGRVEGSGAWGGLNISQAGNEDWFRFETAARGGTGDYVRLEFSHALGDVDIKLYNASSGFIDGAYSANDNEEISLAGLDAGTYYVCVYGYAGQTNPAYTLKVRAPEPTVNADWAEPNDSRSSAYNLGRVEGGGAWSGLSIHLAGNEDWFRFETASAATSANFVKIDFQHALGDLDMGLYDSSGGFIAGSQGAANIEQISLANLSAGTYYIKVYGYNSAQNPNYGLTVNAPAGGGGGASDWAEPNNSMAAAYDLRQVEGEQHWNDLSIHQSGEEDWFRFETTAPGADGNYARIDFQHALGDVDMKLYNSSGGYLATSNGVGNSEQISLAGLAAGTYYLRVYGYNGATNPDYDLSMSAPGNTISPDRFEPNNSFAQATDLRNITGTYSAANLSVHVGDEDYFKFTTEGTGTQAHAVIIDFSHAAGNLDLALYDSNRNLLRSSTSATDNESVSLQNLPAGTYYARVYGAGGAANNYSLRIDAPSAPGGGEAWTIMVYMTASNLQSYAFADVNELEVAASRLPGTVNITLLYDQTSGWYQYSTGNGSQSAWGDAGRAIIQPDTNTSRIATTFEKLGEKNTGLATTLTDFIRWSVGAAPADRYGLMLWDHGSGLWGSNYDDESSDHLYISELVTSLSNAGVHFGMIGFDACLMAMAEVGYALRPYTDAFVASEEVISAGGQDYLTSFSVLQTNPASVDGAALGRGMVQSYQNEYQNNPYGWDTLSATRGSQYDALTAALLGFTNAVRGNAASGDWTIISNARSGATSFYSSPDYRDLGQFMSRIANSSAKSAIRTAAQGVLTALGDAVISHTNSQRSETGLSIYLPSSSVNSQYYSEHRAFCDATGWNTFLSSFVSRGATRGAAQMDWAEANDTASLAWNLHTLTGQGHNYTGLSIHHAQDEDWFRFSTEANGSAGDEVAISCDASLGAMTLEVYDAARNLVGRSVNGGGTVSLAGLASGDYLVRVFSQSSSLAPDYTMRIDAPRAADPAPDWTFGNDASEKAFDLGLVAAEMVISGLNVDAGSDDWFAFETPRHERLLEGTIQVLCGSTPVTATLYSPDGTALGSVTGAQDIELPYSSGLGAAYFLSISDNGAMSRGGYSLRFTPPSGEAPVSQELTLADGEAFTFLDATNDLVGIYYSGAGEAHVIFSGPQPDGSDIERIVISGSASSSTIQVLALASGDSPVGVIDISGAGFRSVTVDGDLGELIFDIGNRTVRDIIVAGTLGGLEAAEVRRINRIEAGRIAGHINAQEIRRLLVAGDVEDASISLDGSKGRIKELTVGGDVLNSEFSVYHSIKRAGIAGDVVDSIFDAFGPKGRLDRFYIGGDAVGSVFEAHKLGRFYITGSTTDTVFLADGIIQGRGI